MSNSKGSDPKNQDKQASLVEKYEIKKRRNFDFTPFMLGKASDKALERIDGCGAYLQFLTTKGHDKHKLYKGFFCHNRWCPFCAWRKARKNSLKLSIMMKAIREKYRFEFLFVTLTARRVPGAELQDEINRYNKAFLKLMKWKKFRGWGEKRSGEPYRGFVQGYAKKIEVTYDGQERIDSALFKKKKAYFEARNLKVGDLNPQFDTYHPHIHALIAVRPSFFTHGYVKKSEWLENWRKAMGDENIQAVDVQRVKGMDQKDKIVLEVAKYSSKDSDYLQSQEVFDEFYAALKNKRVLEYAGIFKEFAKRYDAGEFDHYKEKDDNEYIYMLMARFNPDLMAYEREYRELTESEVADIYPYEGDNPNDSLEFVPDYVLNRYKKWRESERLKALKKQ